MKRTLFVLSFLALFAGSVFADNEKLDKKLNDKVKHSKGNEKVRVIITRFTSSGIDKDENKEKDDIRKDGGTILREFKLLHAQVVEIPVSVLEKHANKPGVQRMSLDERVTAHVGGESYVASGAALANQNYGVTGRGIGVAVIDSGIANHPDLAVAKTVDFITPSNTGGYDPFGHGTHVAGIVAGNGEAADGAHHGIAPNVNLVDLRVLDQNGGGYTSDAIAAIDWAVANANSRGNNGHYLNIRVINLSLGHLTRETAANDPLAQACRAAVQNGMVVVASAGNYGKDSLGNPLYEWITTPGIEPSVITVGAMTTWGTDSRSDDTPATYSSRGPTLGDHFLKPDIAAPGSRVISALSPGSYLATTYPQLVSDDNYLRLSGTSMAAAVVSGAAALMLEKNPSLHPNAVKAALMYTAEPENSVPHAQISVGAGYVNIAGAVNLAANINTSAPAGQNWLMNNGLGLDYSEVIAGTPAVWGKTIIWGTHQYATSSMFYNSSIWTQDTIVWDSSTTIFGQDTIIWDQAILAQDTIIWDQTIVSGQDTIIWDQDTIVWDQNGDPIL